MKKITSAVLGLSLTLATAGFSLAAQDTKAPAASNDTTTAPTAKKHAKKHKKSAKDSTTDNAAPAANPTK